jgi:2-polyprenyl-3-methyl-5-hydroxy-6-metoxy-1,4-benzoquinol methylase
MTDVSDYFEIDKFPFFVGMREMGETLQLPRTMPLRLRIDPDLAIPRVLITPKIKAELEKAYGIGSLLSTPLGQSSLAQDRMDEMTDGLRGAAGRDFAGLRFLEIGCGYGDLLNAIRCLGGDVVGAEIGPQGDEARKRFGIQIVNGPLRADLFEQKFDCIYSYGCLEHILELEEFFDTCRSLLSDGGLFFHSVPNTDATYASARIGDLCHEHISYFTAENGERLLRQEGFRDIGTKPTKAGNELHLFGTLDQNLSRSRPVGDARVVAAEKAKFKSFWDRALADCDRQVTFVRDEIASGRTVGFYAGGHIVAAQLETLDQVRFFDGDAKKHGKCWLEGFPPVGDPLELREDPIDTIIVCPDHYFDPISAYLRDDVGLTASTRLLKLTEI